jgi:hypothetical protein
MLKRNLALILPCIGLSIYGASLAQTATQKSTLQPSENKRAVCRDVSLTRRPGWVLSGGFTPEGSQLFVVDALNQTILRYSNAGQSLGAVGQPMRSMLGSLLPVTGTFRGSDFILQVSDGLMLLDKSLRPEGTKRLQSYEGEWRVDGLWEWEPVGTADVVAFVDIVHGDHRNNLNNWKTAFVRFPLQGTGKVDVLKDFALSGTPNKGYFRTGYHYITSLGEAAYFLSMNEGLTLFKSEKGGRLEDVSRLLPKALQAPVLPDWNVSKEYVDLMRRIERQSMPVGLFGWQGSLYLLYRSPQGDGTRWALYSIDPSGERPSRSVTLPIRASHVTVFPGSQDWAFVEKGPVIGYGVQEISRVLFIPSRLLTAPLRSGVMVCAQ